MERSVSDSHIRRFTLPKIGDTSPKSKADMLKKEEKFVIQDNDVHNVNPKVLTAMSQMCERLQSERNTFREEIEQLRIDLSAQSSLAQSFRSKYESEKAKNDYQGIRLEEEIKRTCELNLDIKRLTEENRALKYQKIGHEESKSRMEDSMTQLRRDLYETMTEQNRAAEAQKRIQEFAALTESHTQLQNKLATALDELSKLKQELQSFVSSPIPQTPRNAEAPVGKVTIVFTDIENSTALWESYPSTMCASLMMHNDLMRDLASQHNGYEVKTEGDAFMLAFEKSCDALTFCYDVQEGLIMADWPEELSETQYATEETINDTLIYRGLRVRMGMHCGVPLARIDPVTGRMDYFGQMVNKAARISAKGKGGQILISNEVYDEIKGSLELMNRSAVLDLGSHSLKDIKKPQQIMQMLPKSLNSRTFPPIAPHNDSPKILQQFLSTKVNKLLSDNERLRSHIVELEQQMGEISSEASRITTQMTALQESEVAVPSETVALMFQSFTKMQERQQELSLQLNLTSLNERNLTENVNLLLRRTQEIEEEEQGALPSPKISLKSAANMVAIKKRMKDVMHKKVNVKVKEYESKIQALVKDHDSRMQKKQITISNLEAKNRMLESKLKILNQNDAQKTPQLQLNPLAHPSVTPPVQSTQTLRPVSPNVPLQAVNVDHYYLTKFAPKSENVLRMPLVVNGKAAN